MRFLSKLTIILLIATSISYLNLASDRIIGATESKELNEFVARFHEEMDARGVKLKYNHISVRFVKEITVSKGAVAIAYPYLIYYFIDVLEESYRKETQEVREALIFHELGHVFGLNHTDSYKFQYPFRTVCPISVMHPSDSLRDCYTLHRKQYLDEMADRIKKLDGLIEL